MSPPASLTFASSTASARSPAALRQPSWSAPPLVSFLARRGGLRLRLARAAGPNGAANGAASPGDGANGLPKNRRDILLEYVTSVQPEFMELFVKRAHTQNIKAAFDAAIKVVLHPPKLN